MSLEDAADYLVLTSLVKMPHPERSRRHPERQRAFCFATEYTEWDGTTRNRERKQRSFFYRRANAFGGIPSLRWHSVATALAPETADPSPLPPEDNSSL
jgi:putative SOS response-associated peptidase YedK